MGTSRWEQISALYHAALGRPPAERSAFLNEACEGEPALQQELESLLRYQSASAQFLEGPAANILVNGPRAPNATTDMVGRQLGPYKVIALLGSGGMGEVYRARDRKLGREVAIKILPPHFTAEPERRARFAREARLLATLNHPHIGAIYGLEESDGITALILELVEGETLAELLTRGPLRVPHALAIARQIADALDAAHEKGIVHRDLKPANIVLQRDAGSGPGDVRVKVLDFGLAKSLAVRTNGDPVAPPETSLSGTEEGRILGTPAYLSPEQARGQPVDKRTDLWAFGCSRCCRESRRSTARRSPTHSRGSSSTSRTGPSSRLRYQLPSARCCGAVWRRTRPGGCGTSATWASSWTISHGETPGARREVLPSPRHTGATDSRGRSSPDRQSGSLALPRVRRRLGRPFALDNGERSVAVTLRPG
jgi:serine/threonine protein kinase